MEQRSVSAPAASQISLEQFFEVANRSVLRTMQAEGLVDRKEWPFGPITIGIIYMPPDLRGQIPTMGAGEQ